MYSLTHTQTHCMQCFNWCIACVSLKCFPAGWRWKWRETSILAAWSSVLLMSDCSAFHLHLLCMWTESLEESWCSSQWESGAGGVGTQSSGGKMLQVVEDRKTLRDCYKRAGRLDLLWCLSWTWWATCLNTHRTLCWGCSTFWSDGILDLITLLWQCRAADWIAVFENAEL